MMSKVDFQLHESTPPPQIGFIYTISDEPTPRSLFFLRTASQDRSAELTDSCDLQNTGPHFKVKNVEKLHHFLESNSFVVTKNFRW